jgi:hypothetical protein
MFNNIITFFLFALLSFVTQLTVAGTPDGKTPATETVCDELKVETPGLYGLCVAYCEAQDLNEAGNEKPSMDSLLKAYNKKRIKQDGPEMPCLNCETCPDGSVLCPGDPGPGFCPPVFP